MFLKMFLTVVLVCPAALADRLTLKDGRVVEGIFFGGTSREIRMAIADKVQSYEITDIQSIQFGSGASIAPAAAAAPAPVPAGKEVPVGTALVIRLIDDVDSERDSIGQKYRASLDESIVVDGATLLQRGADVTVRLVEDKSSGRLTGRTELSLDVSSLMHNGRELEVATEAVTTASESRTGQTATRVGGLAAAGAVIGAIAGGGRGAAIGATTGAGAGAAVQVVTKGPTVKIPSETRLQFTLRQPLRM